MATLVGTFFHSHGGSTTLAPENWRTLRLRRPVREDVPVEDDETNFAKCARIHDSFRVLREKIAELETDVLVVFSDDQLQCFDFNNYPAFSVFVGEQFRKGQGRSRDIDANPAGRHAEPGYLFNGSPNLAVATLTGVMKRGFDPAFSMDMPKPDRGPRQRDRPHGRRADRLHPSHRAHHDESLLRPAAHRPALLPTRTRGARGH